MLYKFQQKTYLLFYSIGLNLNLKNFLNFRFELSELNFIESNF